LLRWTLPECEAGADVGGLGVASVRTSVASWAAGTFLAGLTTAGVAVAAS
jgi:hypothetical protein